MTLPRNIQTSAQMFGGSAIEDDREVVIFIWSNEFGHCYECGIPAAYYLPAAYSPTGLLGLPIEELVKTIQPHELRCSVCAAQAAAEGEPIVHLFSED